MRDDSGLIQTFADRSNGCEIESGRWSGASTSSEVLCESEWGLGDSPDGLDRFVDIVLGVTTETVGLVKPQSAFLGVTGLARNPFSQPAVRRPSSGRSAGHR